MMLFITVICVRVSHAIVQAFFLSMLEETFIVLHEHTNVLVQLLISDLVLIQDSIDILEDLICYT